MLREKEPGIEIEEARSRLRLEEIETQASSCEACARERAESGDPTTYCSEHLRKIYATQR